MTYLGTKTQKTTIWLWEVWWRSCVSLLESELDLTYKEADVTLKLDIIPFLNEVNDLLTYSDFKLTYSDSKDNHMTLESMIEKLSESVWKWTWPDP